MKLIKKIVLLAILISIATYGRINQTEPIKSFDKIYYQNLILSQCTFDHKENFINLEDSIFESMIVECEKYKHPYNVYFSVIDKESGFLFIKNSTGSGAFGYWQLMPKTYKYCAKKLGLKGGQTPINNIKAGSYHLSQIFNRWKKRKKSDKIAWEWTLAEYEAGLGGLQLTDSTGKISYHIPDQCQRGIQKVMRNF